MGNVNGAVRSALSEVWMPTFQRVGFVILIAVLATTCNPGLPGLSSFDKDVNELIRKRCTSDAPCQIAIAEATSFDWDEMYIFRPGIVDGEAELIVPAAKGFEGEFNRKIAFVKQGKLVKIDEAASIIEGENTPPGMLFFDQGLPGNPDCLRYSRSAGFKVKEEKWSRGNVYQLACSNCQPSPVFAEFGTASEKSRSKL